MRLPQLVMSSAFLLSLSASVHMPASILLLSLLLLNRGFTALPLTSPLPVGSHSRNRRSYKAPSAGFICNSANVT